MTEERAKKEDQIKKNRVNQNIDLKEIIGQEIEEEEMDGKQAYVERILKYLTLW